jgi:CRP-like cAMP-binding protein
MVSSGPAASFLERLGPAERSQLERAGDRRRHRTGAVVFHEGGDSDGAIVVLQGHVKVVKLSVDGRAALIELRGPGDLLGEQGVIDRASRSASVVALTELTVLHLPAARFRELLRIEAPITNAVLETVVARLRRASLRQLELSTSDAVSRVCARLTELAARFGRPQEKDARSSKVGEIVVDSPLSQQELADWVGLSRDGVVRALQILRRQGLVKTSRQQFVLVDPDAVARRAEGRDGSAPP